MPHVKSLKPSDIVPDVLAVLKKVGHRHRVVTAYQILQRLPRRSKLILERGWPGASNGRSYTAATIVAQAADMLVDKHKKADRLWLDTEGISLKCKNKLMTAGTKTCALYRLV